MRDPSSRNHSNPRSSFHPRRTQNTPLDKLFRLYSPNNSIPVPKISSSLPKKQNEKAVIQLIFPHPNLLFIHPHNIQDPAEKQAFLQLNMMKNIIQRKKQKVTKNLTSPKNLMSPKAKPMTAPDLRGNNDKNISLMTLQKKQNEDSVNVCTFICDKENNTKDFSGSGMICRQSKTFTSKSQFRKAYLKQKENEQMRNEKDIQNKVHCRNTFEFILEQKKKELAEKYDGDKITREEFYRKSIKSPKTQMYINIEGKFLKYFKQL